MKKSISLLLFIISSFGLIAQQTNKKLPTDNSSAGETPTTTGISVSPSSLRFNVKPGSIATKQIKVTNDTKKPYKFQVAFSDFQMAANGSPMSIKAYESKYTLSKWVTASPSFFELTPGENKTITVTIDIPNDDTANIAAWTIMTIDQSTERAPLDASTSGKAISLGIIPSFGFGVYIYQNPPNVKLTSVEIQKFSFEENKGKRNFKMEAENKGDGIGFCSSYVELTNTTTGKQERLPIRQYTILPGFHRTFMYPLPDKLASGKYSAVGILDFGSKDQIEASELEFAIP